MDVLNPLPLIYRLYLSNSVWSESYPYFLYYVNINYGIHDCAQDPEKHTFCTEIKYNKKSFESIFSIQCLMEVYMHIAS